MLQPFLLQYINGNNFDFIRHCRFSVDFYALSVCICVFWLTMMIVVNNLHQWLNKEHLLSQVAELDVKKRKKKIHFAMNSVDGQRHSIDA